LGENIDYTLRNEKGNPRRIFKHFYEAKPGDIAITYESTPVLQVVAIGRVVAETDGEVLTIEKIEELSSPIPYAEILANPILKKSEPGLNRCQGSLFRLTKEGYDEVMRLIRINNPEPEEKSEIEMPVYPPYTNDDFLSEVYMAEESLNDLKNLLDLKKNVILQGAPGVGKTFSAKRLAYVMMGAKDDSRIKIIQFHQNYSYEDFIMGYKPNATGGFELKEGVFYDFCKKAAQDPDNKYFFIIDEINRGNMSKIFGELLQLIEVDYRNHPIKLAYNNQDFAVPANVYIIGMMNTADRSLAMIDYAIRRRFSFFTMAPAFELDSFKQHINNINDPKLNQLIDKVIELNKAIKNDSSLGEGFVIGHSYFCPDSLDLRTIVRYEILPTLSEYWFDNETIIQQWENELLDVIK
ncbi:MAG: AAA family ATPase, partial [Paludibacteraceae bacterium]|nr:AAA family ATPase [Paludibacteraceae bacterium]